MTSSNSQRHFLILFAFCLVIQGCTSRVTDRSRAIDIGNGRSIFLECKGNGRPTVILVTGKGERADNWMITTNNKQPVFQGVASFTTVCAYDRPGTAKLTEKGWELSRSTSISYEATVKDSAEDLNALLAASGEPAPYVLVGHSLGGPIIRLYASEHPDKVAAFVFDDALSEYLIDGLDEEQLRLFEKLNEPDFQGGPPNSEKALFSEAVVPLMRAAKPPPQVPTIILTADQWVLPELIASGKLPKEFNQHFSDALWKSQIEAQKKFAALFKDVRHVTKTNADHYIHRTQPQLVIDSIREVVDQVRSASESHP
jgi:pimeloyl-ACP methyl ester carboxylesterase